ncbi:hypothetical protein F53441_4781 [Fusarium austroafricanum]|uniref:Uncharacterized protein n=1 Tax=Fusarium austroafricanum TaxID=2364996 RepID=A0A8H4P927_9HYPO|nr:hypothetical protein F53441_4781 [Fusarium austroafricanum]
MGPSTRNLVFVNKNTKSTSLSNSRDGERAFILSHVQRRRRQEPAWSQHTSQIALKQETNNDDSGVLRLLTNPSFNGSDPFHCTIVALDAGNHAMLRFTFDQGAKLTFLAEAFAPSTFVGRTTQMRHERAINKRLRRCVEDKALMYSTLAYGSCCQGWMAGIIDQKRPPIYFIDKALQTVRLHLQDAKKPRMDEWLALSIYSLAITEFWTATPSLWMRCPEGLEGIIRTPKSENSAARTHLNALLTVVDKAGGWGQFDPYVLESTILVDKFLALTEFKTPILPLTWDPISISLRLVENAIPKSFGQYLPNKIVSIDLRIIVQDIISYVHHAVSYWSSGQRHADNETKLFRKLQALIYRLLYLEDVLEFDDCIRLVTLIFLLNVTQYHGAQVSARTLLPRLREALIKARFWSNEFDEGIRFWCLYTAAMTTEVSPDKDWFICMASRYYLPSVLGYRVREGLSNCLFLPDRQGSQLSVLEDKLATLP